jgi:hypothetical protein
VIRIREYEICRVFASAGAVSQVFYQGHSIRISQIDLVFAYEIGAEGMSDIYPPKIVCINVEIPSYELAGLIAEFLTCTLSILFTCIITSFIYEID